jgi:hypothetical protein
MIDFIQDEDCPESEQRITRAIQHYFKHFPSVRECTDVFSLIPLIQFRLISFEETESALVIYENNQIKVLSVYPDKYYFIGTFTGI